MTPAPSQTLTSLHVCRFSLSCGCTQLETFHHGGSQSFTPSPPESQRPLLRETWGSSDALLEHRGLGDAVGQGCCREGPREGSQWLCPPLGPQAMGFLCLPLTFGMVFTSGTASLQAADPTHPSPAPAMVPVSYKSWMGTKHGQEVVKTPTPDLHQSRTQASHSHSLTHSLTPTVPWCGLTQPLIYEPSTWLVGWWLLF